MERTWVDPRYFMYLHTLTLQEQRLFSFMGEPIEFEVPLIPLAPSITSSSYSHPDSQCLLASPFGSLPQPPVPLMIEGGFTSSSSSSSSSSTTSTQTLRTPPLCMNPFCTNPRDPHCTQRMCSRCCHTTSCKAHSALLKRKQQSTFDSRAKQLREKIQSMHKPEPESWKEKPRLMLTLRRDHLLADSFRDRNFTCPCGSKWTQKVSY